MSLGSCIHRYILFDGDVDALWVENMNSVMDDNKLLTLANGERIRLQSHCALLFEVGNGCMWEGLDEARSTQPVKVVTLSIL